MVQDVFERKFKIAEEDITSVLRKVMLDQEIMEDLHSGLVISLLAPSPLMPTKQTKKRKTCVLAASIPNRGILAWVWLTLAESLVIARAKGG
eukprot:2036680-Rhodomonas_salina.1